jgi:hypothetical protein
MHDLIEELQVEVFGVGGRHGRFSKKSQKGMRAATKKMGQHHMKTKAQSGASFPKIGQHLAARSRLARMKMKARARKKAGG